MTKFGRKTKYICTFLCFILAMNLSIAFYNKYEPKNHKVYAENAGSTMIRVGLEGIYYNKSSMSIRNESLVLGYAVDNSYYKELTLTGGSFTIRPFTDAISKNGTYSSYKDAKAKALEFVGEGKEAYPVLMYLGAWTVYVVGEGEKDNYAMLVVSASGEKLIYTVDSHFAYPQMTAGNADKNGVYVVDLGERQYRGRLEMGRYGGISLIKTVNIVELEEYLCGVIPCEMVSSWHEEALKAQAVCARSYAYTSGFGSETNIHKPYNICDTTSSQVYKGYGAEKTSTNKAVMDTKGEILYYNNTPVRAYYSSTSGGSTENVEDVWGTPSAYLRQVSDIYELEPELEPWIISISADKIKSLMDENGVSVGDIKDIRPFVMTSSGRVYSVEILGDKSQIITGSQMRKIFSLYSTKYKVIKYGDNPDYVSVLTDTGKKAVEISESYIASGGYEVNKADKDIEQFVVITADNLMNYPAKAPEDKNTYYMAGMGYGHGIGMSQSGAKGMAESGFLYQEILKHYFTGVEVR